MRCALSFCLVLIAISGSEGGFRCWWGDWACSAGCVMMGQTSGMCDSSNSCWCSERSISTADFKALLPSRCDLGLPFCQSTCHSIGRKDGSCGYTGCSCSSERLSSSEFMLCSEETACVVHCQGQGRASGKCEGWECQCKSRGDFGSR